MILYDSVTGNACPLDAQAIAGYVDGPYGPGDIFGSGWSQSAWNRYPKAYHVTITVKGKPGARVADCEPGAIWPPAKVAQWAKSEIAAGRRPTIYGDLYDWSEIGDSIDKALAAVGLERGRDVDGWVASVGPAVIPPGFVALQYAQDQPGVNGGRVDLSVTNGVWPGEVTPPKPTPTVCPEDIMALLASDPDFAVRFLYRFCLHREADAAGFATYVNALNAGSSLNEVMAQIQDSPEGIAVIAAERKALGLAAV